jgi:predicted AlkP superfamily phosphohydrolase/phosphomutase
MLKKPSLRVVSLVAAVTLSLAFACQGSGPQDIHAKRVVMISYDAVGADLAWSWIEDGTARAPGGLRDLAQHGISAERLRMVDPTLTTVNHLTLVTGRDAAGTGVVSNSFHCPGTPITDSVSGFTASSDAETLWEAARKHGLRVATLLWPGADAGAADRMGDFGATWPPPPLAASEIIELEPGTAATTGEVPSNDGLPALMWRIAIALDRATPSAIDVLVALVDANPNGRPRYDTVAVKSTDSDEWAYAGEMEWLEVGFETRSEDDLRPHRYGSWCKVLHIDRIEGSLRFYRGSVSRLHAYPDGFEDRLAEAIGPWPGEPDGGDLAAWWLDLAEGVDLDTYLEQAERLDRYLDRMADWVIVTEDPDLMLAYHPSADEYQHTSLITNPLQWAYSPGRALAAGEGLKRVGRSIDLSVATMWSALDPESDALVVVSDHGQMPIFETVGANHILAGEGLLKTVEENGRQRVAADTPMVAISHAAVINLYLNLKGREPTGVVAPEEAPEYLRRAARAFADLEAEGRPAVEKIMTRSEAAAIGLDSPNAGDLMVFLAPGFAASAGFEGPSMEPSRYYGQHGFLASHGAMCGILFARGAGIKRAHLGEVKATAVAPMVARWLEFTLGGPGG